MINLCFSGSSNQRSLPRSQGGSLAPRSQNKPRRGGGGGHCSSDSYKSQQEADGHHQEDSQLQTRNNIINGLTSSSNRSIQTTFLKPRSYEPPDRRPSTKTSKLHPWPSSLQYSTIPRHQWLIRSYLPPPHKALTKEDTVGCGHYTLTLSHTQEY